MKFNKNVIISLVLLVVIASVYRAIPGRPWGFAPQIAMALFGGSLFVNDKKWAFALPLISMFLSDALYQLLYNNGLTTIQGFYKGQWQNYLLFAALTVIGFAVKPNKIVSIVTGAVAAPTVFFLVSNFMVWMGGGGLHRAKTFDGLLQCYTDALPFYYGGLSGTLFFSAVLFGGYYLLKQKESSRQLA